MLMLMQARNYLAPHVACASVCSEGRGTGREACVDYYTCSLDVSGDLALLSMMNAAKPRFSNQNNLSTD